MKSAAQAAADIAEFKKTGPTKAEVSIRAAEDMIGWPYAWGATGQKCTVKNREARMKNAKISQGDINLIKKRCQILSGKASSCNGCKYFPGGEATEIHDCIGFINDDLNQAGIAHYGAGCTTMWNHTKNWSMKGKLSSMPETVCLVFQQQGSRVNHMDHIGLYIGDGWVIHCSVEVKKQKITDYPWTHFAIPSDLGGDVPPPAPTPVTHRTLKRGCKGEDVKECQTDLVTLHYDIGPCGIDGVYGRATMAAVTAFQGASGLKQDGICGPKTWEALTAAVAAEGSGR